MALVNPAWQKFTRTFPFLIMERSLDFVYEKKGYVSDVVLYTVDIVDLLPAVPYKKNRRGFYDDYPEQVQENTGLVKEGERGGRSD